MKYFETKRVNSLSLLVPGVKVHLYDENAFSGIAFQVKETQYGTQVPSNSLMCNIILLFVSEC